MLITRDDIQRIGDEDTLLHFLEEKLKLSIPEGTTLEDITTKFGKLTLGLSEVVAYQVLDCQELSVSPGEFSGIILIRFNSESGYAEVLRAVAEGLNKLKRDPTDLRFICMNEYFQPYAFAYFSDSKSENWQTAVLNIRAWTQENTYIHTSSEHKLPTDFFPNAPTNQPIVSTSSETLLSKLENTGTPLETHWNIHLGINTGYNPAFVINESKRQQLIAADASSAELIKLAVGKHQRNRWQAELKYLIWIPSSKFKRWPWSNAKDELEADRIFEETYPAINKHLNGYRDKLSSRSTTLQGEFYWELSKHKQYPEFHQPKIICYNKPPIVAYYDTSGAFVINTKVCSIPTTDFSLLAILNSKLFWCYKEWSKLDITKRDMKKVPIAERTYEQKAVLSNLVQQILDDPDSSKVSDIEKEIDTLVYDLYNLTAAEIALIEEETSQ